MSSMLPMLNPDDIEIDGWDISDMNLAEAIARAKVLDINLQLQLRPHMMHMRPRKSIYYPDFIASNQVSHFSRLFPTYFGFYYLVIEYFLQRVKERTASFRGPSRSN